MKNSDMPASPIQHEGVVIQGGLPAIGLSKREAFAMAAMQGMLSSKYYSDFCGDGHEITKNNNPFKSIKAMAYSYADEMLDES